MHRTTELSSDNTKIITLQEIDIHLFLNGDEAIQKAITQTVDQELHTIGAFRIVNHGLSSELINHLFSESRDFFDSSDEYKSQYKSAGILGSNGFEPIGTANIGKTFNDSSKPDLVESLIFWFEHLLRAKNEFGEQEIFKYSPQKLGELIIEFGEKSKVIIDALQQIFTLSLGLDVNQFKMDMECEDNVDTNQDCYFSGLRLWNYLALNDIRDKADYSEDRFGAHTDFNMITLVRDDGVNGLQYKLERIDDEWYTLNDDAKYVSSDSLIVNIGEVIQMYTNGYWIAPIHRVATLSPNRRQSVVYFVAPRLNAIIDEIKECDKCQQNRDHQIMDRYALPLEFRKHAKMRFSGSYSHQEMSPFFNTQL